MAWGHSRGLPGVAELVDVRRHESEVTVCSSASLSASRVGAQVGQSDSLPRLGPSRVGVVEERKAKRWKVHVQSRDCSDGPRNLTWVNKEEKRKNRVTLGQWICSLGGNEHHRSGHCSGKHTVKIRDRELYS